jgi:hypothetical protein
VPEVGSGGGRDGGRDVREQRGGERAPREPREFRDRDRDRSGLRERDVSASDAPPLVLPSRNGGEMRERESRGDIRDAGWEPRVDVRGGSWESGDDRRDAMLQPRGGGGGSGTGESNAQWPDRSTRRGGEGGGLPPPPGSGRSDLPPLHIAYRGQQHQQSEAPPLSLRQVMPPHQQQPQAPPNLTSGSTLLGRLSERTESGVSSPASATRHTPPAGGLELGDRRGEGAEWDSGRKRQIGGQLFCF